MAKKKFLKSVKESAGIDVLEDLDEPVMVEEPTPEPAPEPVAVVEPEPIPIPEKTNGVKYIMTCPKDKLPFWTTSGCYIFYNETVRIDKQGFAHVRKKNTVLAMEKEGFNLVA